MKLDIQLAYDYERYNTIYDRIRYIVSKKVVLQIVLIINSQVLEVIHIIIYLMKRY